MHASRHHTSGGVGGGGGGGVERGTYSYQGLPQVQGPAQSLGKQLVLQELPRGFVSLSVNSSVNSASNLSLGVRWLLFRGEFVL